MSLASIVKDACERLNIPVAELARRTNQSPQNLGKKLRNGTLNYDEFTEALSCLGVRYEYRLVFPDTEPEEMASEHVRDMAGILSGQIGIQRKTIELLQDISRDVGNEIRIIESAADAAVKHKEDRRYVQSCLSQIRLTVARIRVLLQDAEGLNALDPDRNGGDAE